MKEEDSSVTPIRIQQTNARKTFGNLNAFDCNLNAFDYNHSVSFAMNMSNWREEPRNRPDESQRIPVGLGSQIS